ncbi:UNVERIFIED_CONTAM: hypothetical protein NCL1_56904 [Trichonephila clavipes]
MSEELFPILLDLVGLEISKQDTNYRKSITAEEGLSICLRGVCAPGKPRNSGNFEFRYPEILGIVVQKEELMALICQIGREPSSQHQNDIKSGRCHPPVPFPSPPLGKPLVPLTTSKLSMTFF